MNIFMQSSDRSTITHFVMRACIILSMTCGILFCASLLVETPYAYAQDAPGDDPGADAPGDETGGVIVPIDPIIIDNPLDINTVEELLGRILVTIQGIVAVLAILFIVIGGVLYITSGGNASRITAAKSAITAALIGLALALAGPSFLSEIYKAIGADNTAIGDELVNAPTITDIAMRTLQFLLSIVGILSIIALVIGGLMYITSGGNQNRTKTAKDIVVYAIMGLVISLVSLVIVRQIVTLF